MEDGHAGAQFARGGGRAFVVEAERVLGGAGDVGLGGVVKAALLHEAPAPLAVARTRVNDVEEDAVGLREEAARLADLVAQDAEVWRSEAEQMVAGHRRRKLAEAERRAVFVSAQPLRVQPRQPFVESGGEIDWRGDADFLRRLDLRAQQVELERRVHRAGLRRMVGPAVVALGEEGD